MREGLLDPAGTAALRRAVANFTVGEVAATLGPAGERALAGGDFAGVEHALGRAGDVVADLIRLFLLGAALPAERARRALDPLPLEQACHAGLLTGSAGSVRALVEIRPYAELADEPAPWWVVADFGSDVRPGPLAVDHVLGIGAASLTLAQLTPRPAVGRALDIGTGCGIQALHLGRHAAQVTATDVSERALRFAATTAALSGQVWQLWAGSLLDPIRAGDTFDLVVANPPFVVSDGRDGYRYRDSGRPGDGLCAALVRAVPRVLAPRGSAHLLANWQIPVGGEPWTERVRGWLAGTGCDAWVWQREVAEPADYVALWLRDSGLTPARPEWAARYAAWLDWFSTAGVAAIGMGYVSMWRTDADRPVQVLEDVPQAVQQPVGPQVAAWIERQRWLDLVDDATLCSRPLRACAGLVRDRSDLLDADGWRTVGSELRQTTGLRWRVAVNDAIAGLVAGCSGEVPLGVLISVLAAATRRPTDEVARAALPVVRDLLGRGILLPPEPQ